MKISVAVSLTASLAVLATPAFAALDASVPDAATRDSGASRPDASALDASAPDATPGSDAGAVHVDVPVGAACTKTAECAAGLTCLPQTSEALGGGAPANGLCTADCSSGGQAACDAVDLGSLCGSFDADGKIRYCFERCSAGSSGDALKCHGRVDMACAPANTGEGYCAPTCRGDYDCGSRRCDPVSGLCVDSVKGTLATGSACDPAAATTQCFGACTTFVAPASEATSMCTTVCSLGAPDSCGQVQSDGGHSPDSACLFPLAAGESSGDIGFCAQLCDCDSDCRNDAFVCVPVPLTSGIGRPGVCSPGTDALGQKVQGTSCGAGTAGAGGASGSKGTGGSAGSTTEDGGVESPAPAAKDDSGCGCRVAGGTRTDTGSGSRSAPLLMVLGLAGLAFRRRR